MCNKWNELKPEEMPYEKCMTLGAESLTDAELLAILLRTGTKNHTVLEVAEKVLSMNPEFDGLVGMMHFTPDEYRQVEGIGRVKAVQLSVVGEIALCYFITGDLYRSAQHSCRLLHHGA